MVETRQADGMAEGEEVWGMEDAASGDRERARHRGKRKEATGNMHRMVDSTWMVGP